MNNKREVSTSFGVNGVTWLFAKRDTTNVSRKQTKTSQKLYVEVDDDNCLCVCLEYLKRQNCKNIEKTEDEVHLTDVEGKQLRDFLAIQVPFTKQELVDLMTATTTTKGDA